MLIWNRWTRSRISEVSETGRCKASYLIFFFFLAKATFCILEQAETHLDGVFYERLEHPNTMVVKEKD